mgnify:CR=1 FL=1|tara:strand:- start:94036 stop:95598 length:1563 start_codon:yes stop_codon:yes gene_type:complete
MFRKRTFPRRRKHQRRLVAEPLEHRRVMAASLGWDGAGLGSAELTYYIGNSPDSLSQADTDAAIETALQAWSNVIDVTFVETDQSRLNNSIDITFTNIDGGGGTLAQAYFPDDVNPARIAGDIQFDIADAWEVGNSLGNQAFDLVWVAAHEIGHALGLDHIDIAGTVLAPFVSANQSFAGLTAADIDAGQRVYAAAVNMESEHHVDIDTDDIDTDIDMDIDMDVASEGADDLPEPNTPDESIPDPNNRDDSDGGDGIPAAPDANGDDTADDNGTDDNDTTSDDTDRQDDTDDDPSTRNRWRRGERWYRFGWRHDSDVPQNQDVHNPTDVNGDRETTAVDALTIVNLLNRFSVLTDTTSIEQCDTNGDGVITAADALLVINALSRKVTDSVEVLTEETETVSGAPIDTVDHENYDHSSLDDVSTEVTLRDVASSGDSAQESEVDADAPGDEIALMDFFSSRRVQAGESSNGRVDRPHEHYSQGIHMHSTTHSQRSVHDIDSAFAEIGSATGFAFMRGFRGF